MNTSTGMDASSRWTGCLAILPRTNPYAFAAIQSMPAQQPFALLGLNSDNGTESINDLLCHYCQYQQITCTRSRPYHNNDQTHVEQKNWSVVGRLVG